MDRSPRPMLLTVRHAGRSADVVVRADRHHRVGEVTAALAAHLGVSGDRHALTPKRTRRTLADDDLVADADLLSGDEVTLGPAAAGEPAGRQPIVTIDIVSGPGAGHSVAVPSGSHSIGRHRHADVVLTDALVARQQATIVVGADGCTIVPLADAPPTLVDGRRVVTPHALADDAVIEVGASALVVRRPVAAGNVAARCGIGHVAFAPTPYRPAVEPATASIMCAAPPDDIEPRRVPAWAMLAPLAGGLVMYAFSRQIQFLALTLISPLAMVAGAIDDRRSGRRRHGAAMTAFELAVRQWRSDIGTARLAYVRFLRRLAPDVAQLIRRAETRSPDLWERAIGQPGFLRLRLGLGAAPLPFAIGVLPGGAEQHRRRALDAVGALTSLERVPITVDLDRHRVVALHGPGNVVDGVVASLLAQAACLHAPHTLTITVVGERAIAPTRWLPHSSRAAGADIALADVLGRVELPNADQAPQRHHHLVVVDAAAQVDPALVERLLASTPRSPVSLVWLAPSAAEVTRHATAVLAVDEGLAGAPATGRWWSTDDGRGDTPIELEPISSVVAMRAARALAPIVDASATVGAVPGEVGLLELLGCDRPDAEWIAERWSCAALGPLRFPLGRSAEGDVVLDLVDDGPHALIGGTSGSGKSELLQAMVASLASRYSPAQLNFLFVDYKGGAATQALARLPHTVGCVTDLDAGLASRALLSLRAELRHRMALLEGVAKDLEEMRQRQPDRAPASLVIVVDELATLVAQVPELVDGLIDIAQRGRSLGIHLVLATQRPSGCVNDNVLANTNLRVALRLLDTAESTMLVGSGDAAAIAAGWRGRAIVRHGHGRSRQVQVAYGAGRAQVSAGDAAIVVTSFDQHRQPLAAAAAASPAEPGPSELDVLVDAMAAAAAMLDLAAPRRPWCPPLPTAIGLSALPSARWPEVVVGVLDLPHRQRQQVATIDLAAGPLVVLGGGGMGSTTLLRTITAQVAGAADVVVLDGGTGELARGSPAAAVGLAAAPGDVEALTRVIVTVEGEIEARRATIRRRLRPIVIVIDRWASLTSVLAAQTESHATETWPERLARLMVDGRAVGVTWAVVAERPNAVPASVLAAARHRLVLGPLDAAHRAELGVSSAAAPHLDRKRRPGRGLLDGELVQVAVPPAPAPPSAGRRAPGVVRSLALTERVASSALAGQRSVAGNLQAVLGVADVTGAAVTLDLTWSDAVVIGNARSGRSTALATIAAALAPTHRVATVSALTHDPVQVAEAAGELRGAMHSGEAVPRVLLIDDLDLLPLPDDRTAMPLWTALAADRELRLVVVRTPRTTPFHHPLLTRLRAARRTVYMRPDDPSEFLSVTGLRRAVRPGVTMPPGRAILIADRQQTLLQVAVEGCGAEG